MTLYNLVRQQTSSTGDSDITLGSAVAGCLTMALAGVSDSEDVYYGLITYSLSTRLPVGSETGVGRYIASGPTFQRTTVEASTDSDNSAINLTGYSEIYITPPASYFNAFLTTKAPVMWHDQAIVTQGNAIRFAADATAPYGSVWYQDASADSDEWTNGFSCQAGTYTLKIVGQTSTGNGQLDCYIDNVNLGTTLDWYNGSTLEGQIKSIAGVVLTAGYHTFKGKVNGKNGSSSGYNIAITKYWLEPASY